VVLSTDPGNSTDTQELCLLIRQGATGVGYRRRGRRPTIGHRRWWPEGAVGEVATGGLPPTLQSPRVCAGVASVSKRGREGFSSSRHWSVGSWGFSWAVDSLVEKRLSPVH
jgi:hypothetical protein